MEELLKQITQNTAQIAKNTAPKVDMTITVTDDKTEFEVMFNPLLELDNDKQYKVALMDLETYYSFPNVDANNILITMIVEIHKKV